MELQLVSFEQAKTLKEVGFPQDMIGGYYSEICKPEVRGLLVHKIVTDTMYAAPTLELVAKWLREEKSLSLEPYRTAVGWVCMIVDIPSGTYRCQVGYNYDLGDNEISGQFTTFEKALSAGIDKAIEILKGI